MIFMTIVEHTTELIDLSHELGQVLGHENVAFDDTTRLLYATDASNYQIMPHGVVFPRQADDVSAIHELASRYQIPILPRGAATSLAGQTVGRALVIDFARHMRRVTAINTNTQTVQVEPGMVLGQMNQQLADLGVMFGPDPASANRATIGGCLGNNASGTHSILYRMTADHVRWLDVVLANGEKVRLGNQQYGINTSTTTQLRTKIADLITQHAAEIVARYPKTWRTVAGYALNRLDVNDIDLAQLVVGSEGTLGSIVSAELALVPRPKMTCLAIVHFDVLRDSLEIVPDLLATKPSAIELLDELLIQRTRHRPQPDIQRRLHFLRGNPQAIFIVEYYGNSQAELEAKMTHLHRTLKQVGQRGEVVEIYDADQQADVWYIRKAGLGLLASNRGARKTVAVIEDAAVPVEHLADYIDRIRTIVAEAGAEMSLYAHASAGCLHVRPLLNLKSAEGMRQYRQIGEQAAEAVLEFAGTTTGEHGEGLVRAEFSERLFGTELIRAFREVKHLFDPANLMNPGKVVNSPAMDDENLLRYGTQYQLPLDLIDTRLNWAKDGGFAQAVEMCNGAGVCRKEEAGVMCPSFMATRNEQDSTRGRANMLRLAMAGTLGMETLADKRVKDVLDLCLSCKACQAECPSAVDMARLKTEFMAHYQDEHGTPLRSRLFANVHRLNRWGSYAPRLANFTLNMPVLGTIGKRVMGIAVERDMPRLAKKSFANVNKSEGVASIYPPVEGEEIPILLIDTFLNYYDPSIGQALQYLHKQMQIPFKMMSLPNKGCCGRPAISKGLLDQAKPMVNTLVAGLAEIIDQNPQARFMIVEPSCLSVLQDEMRDLVDEQYRSTAQTIAGNTISVEQWLAECQTQGLFDKLSWDNQSRQLLYHGHCHQKAIWGTHETERILRAIPNVTVQVLDAGCCGMAGSFGYEQEHYATSITIANQRLYPAILANKSAIAVASGTSCRDQIAHIDEKAYHPIEIIAQACGWEAKP